MGKKKKSEHSLLGNLEFEKQSKNPKLIFYLRKKDVTQCQIFFRNSIWKGEYLENISQDKLGLY